MTRQKKSRELAISGDVRKSLLFRQSDILQAICAEEDIEPFRILAHLASDNYTALNLGTNADDEQRHVPLDIRLFAAKEMCKYLYPTLRAVQHTGPGGDSTEFKLQIINQILAKG